PVGVGSGISMGISGTSGETLLGWASAGRATAAATRKAGVERTAGRYNADSMCAVYSAVGAPRVDGAQHGARHQVRGVAARREQRAHLGGRDLRQQRTRAARHGKTGALDGNDARQLLDALEALPLRPRRREIRAEHQGPAVLRMG